MPGRSRIRRWMVPVCVVAALLAASVLPALASGWFVDDDHSPFEQDIEADADVTRGCDPPQVTRVCAGRQVTRGQMAAFLARGPELAPAAPVPHHQTPDEPFRFSTAQVAGHPTVEDRVVGSSWRSGCPVPLRDLRYLRVAHVGFDGEDRMGELVVHEDVVDDVRTAMRRTYEAGFPIRQMRLVDDFGADDGRSMRANNTSAFNCRKVAGTDRWSNHATGRAIDVNPLRNPYVYGDGRTDPPEGAEYADRSDRRPGMLFAGTEEVEAWRDLGWDWGGTWSSAKDYQHFSADGG